MCVNKLDKFLLSEMFEPLHCVLLTQEDLIPALDWRQTRDQVKRGEKAQRESISKGLTGTIFSIVWFLFF